MSAARKRARTRAEDIIFFCNEFLMVPEGAHGGQRVKLRDWQEDLIRQIYDQPTRRAIISFGRKNGKTALTAMLVLAHLVGPEARQNSQIYSAAQSRDQAALVFMLAAKMVRMNRVLNDAVTVRDSAKELFCARTGVRYKALSADATTAYGLSPVLVIHDELGQVKGPRSELYDALETSMGAQAQPLSIVISTQAPTDADLLSTLIDAAKLGDDSKTKVFVYAADEEDDPWDPATWRKANPALEDFLSIEELAETAKQARALPALEAAFRNLHLNQRVEASESFVSKDVWLGCGDPVIESFKGKPVYAGLDLSETSDLTALVLIAAHEGKWHVKPTFWLPAEGLAERARKDRVPYDVWHRQGFLETTPGKSIQYEYIAELLRGQFDRLDIRQLAFDRWNWKHLRPWLAKGGFSESELERFVEFGQGEVSMSPALRTLEGDLLDGKFAHGNHPVLAMCASNSVVHMGRAGNRTLDKKRSHGRIDGMIALAMARAVAATEDLEPAPDYQMFFLGRR
jgi:phage terminase large subunit-like protein